MLVTLPASPTVPYGASPVVSFPLAMGLNARRLFLTTGAGLSGPVTDNVALTARYRTVRGFLDDAVAADEVGARVAGRLFAQWTAIGASVGDGDLAAAKAGLAAFAQRVQSFSASVLPATLKATLVAAAALAERQRNVQRHWRADDLQASTDVGDCANLRLVWCRRHVHQRALTFEESRRRR